MKIIYILLINISLLFSLEIKKDINNYQDIRYVTADILKLRDKPTTKSKQIGLLKYDDKVIILKEVSTKSPYNWVLTTKGYTSSNYLSKKILNSHIKEINLEEKLKQKIIKTHKIKDNSQKSDIEILFGL